MHFMGMRQKRRVGRTGRVFPTCVGMGLTQIFKKLGRTIRQWFEPIIRMWRFTKSNGITEGFHRKMKLIQRRAYGYRNFQNYRLRVLIECGHIVI